jgi:hypothetical protein
MPIHEIFSLSLADTLSLVGSIQSSSKNSFFLFLAALKGTVQREVPKVLCVHRPIEPIKSQAYYVRRHPFEFSQIRRFKHKSISIFFIKEFFCSFHLGNYGVL